MNPPPCKTLAALAGALLAAATAQAQLIDRTQAPNAANEGLAKSLTQEIGAGRGDILTPGSSAYIIARDPFRSIRRGRQIFQRKFTLAQGLGPRAGDGMGNAGTNIAIGAGLADSCAACHGRPRGSGGAGGDVATRPDSRDAMHLFGLGIKEMLGDEMTAELRTARDQATALAQSSGQNVTRSLLAKGVSFGKISARPNGTFDTSLIEGVDVDLRVKPFFAHGGQFSIRAFAAGAFQDEMGLQAVDADLAAAQAGGSVTTPSGLVLNGATDPIQAPLVLAGTDPDGDGVTDEIPAAVLDHMEFYLLNYFKPATYQRTSKTERGRTLLRTVGCTQCHVQKLTVEHDRRVADIATVYDPTRGIFNRLFGTATALIGPITDNPALPTLKPALGGRFIADNFFSDLKRHDLGAAFHERNYDGTLRTHFLTSALWGVGTTAPYGHDGRSINLQEVILRHGGEAATATQRYARLSDEDQSAIRAFLESLVIFPPDDTASNLDPGNPADPLFPQKGHGAFKLGVLFNDPTDPE